MPPHAPCTVLTQTLPPLASTGDPTDAPADTPLDSDPFTHISISGQGVQRDVATFRREPSERRQCPISHTTSRWASEAQRPQTASTLGVAGEPFGCSRSGVSRMTRRPRPPLRPATAEPAGQLRVRATRPAVPVDGFLAPTGERTDVLGMYCGKRHDSGLNGRAVADPA